MCLVCDLRLDRTIQLSKINSVVFDDGVCVCLWCLLLTDTATKRETGREAQLSNIAAAKTLADVIRTCLGPKSMLKMVLDAMGGVALTNDGNAILRVCYFRSTFFHVYAWL